MVKEQKLQISKACLGRRKLIQKLACNQEKTLIFKNKTLKNNMGHYVSKCGYLSPDKTGLASFKSASDFLF